MGKFEVTIEKLRLSGDVDAAGLGAAVRRLLTALAAEAEGVAEAAGNAVAAAEPFAGASPADWRGAATAPEKKPQAPDEEFVMTEAEEREAEAAHARTVFAMKRSGRPTVRVECRERPNELLTYDQVASLAGIQRQSVPPCLSKGARRADGWAHIGDFHFRKYPARVGSPARSPAAGHADPHEARPRSRPAADTLPLNHHVSGGAARVSPAEVAPNGSGRTFKRGGQEDER